MARWLRKCVKLQEFVGLMKDQASVGRALVKSGEFSQIDLAVLRATGHEENIIDEETMRCVLEVGDCSRMCVSHCIRFLMDRLNRTHSWIVALKCLLVIHNCLHEGGFMFQDQLCLRPSRGGRNYLNLSKFRDLSSPFTWATSAWVRWYAKYIEQWIQASKSLGIFLAFHKNDEALHTEKLTSLANWQLLQQMIDVEEFLHEAAGWEADDLVLDHVLVKEALSFIIMTTRKAYSGIKVRFQEVTERISTLTQMEALALIDVWKRLSEDRTSLMHLFENVESTGGDGAFGRIVYTTLELEKLKQTLQHAYLHNRSTSTERLRFMPGLSEMCLSARWESTMPSKQRITDFKRRNSLSLFDSQHDALKTENERFHICDFDKGLF